MSWISEIQTTITRVSESLMERSVAKESELCSTEMEQSRIEETDATQFEIPTPNVSRNLKIGLEIGTSL